MLGLLKKKTKTYRPRILVVDDDPNIAETIQQRLTYYGCEVITAADGEEGLTKAADEKPDLILLDINMPVMNGHDMLKRLRGQEKMRDIPVIMCTVSDEAEDITVASSFNIRDYITKPFYCGDLVEKIMIAMKRENVNM
jgi:DNA-binding response OmpR family regulator